MQMIAEAQIVLSDNQIVNPGQIFEAGEGKHVSIETAKNLLAGGYARAKSEEPVAVALPVEAPAKASKKAAKTEEL